MKKNEDGVWEEDPIHGWFGLTYASYLVLPRVVMESMSLEWQKKMVELLEEIGDKRGQYLDGDYAVQLRNKKGQFTYDPLREYRHPVIEFDED